MRTCLVACTLLGLDSIMTLFLIMHHLMIIVEEFGVHHDFPAPIAFKA